MTDRPTIPLPAPVEPGRLRVRIDPDTLPHASTADYPPLTAFVGQDRAHGAVNFGATVAGEGFNIFAMGAEGSGRRAVLRAVMAARARRLPPGDDWVYVNNFEDAQRPRALRLPHGTAHTLRREMAALIEDLAQALPAAFEGDDYKARRSALEAECQARQEERLAAIRAKAEEQAIALVRTPMGFAFAPLRDGAVVKPEVFNTWPDAEKAEVEARVEALQSELTALFQEHAPRLEKALRAAVRNLDRETAQAAIGLEIREVAESFAGVPAILDHLAAVEADLLSHFHLFLAIAQAGEEVPMAARLEHPALRRYAVNVIAAPEGDGAEPVGVVEESDPTFANLIGRVEYQPQQGALITDFTMIRPGALHRANGGYLILEARALLMQPLAWEALKRALKTGRIRIASLSDRLGLASTISLEPDEIPLSVRVALIGDRRLYYLLAALDPDVATLFKVEADFEDDIDRSPETTALMSHLLAEVVRREKLAPFDRDALARTLEEASRIADDAAKFTLCVAPLADLMREAAHWAEEAGAQTVGAVHVERAVAERRNRAGRLRARAVEMVARDIVTIATEGMAVGQINGLSVLALGAASVGRPARITARTRLGTGRIIDIEREVKLGGPLHSKGVLILSSFLASRYGTERPVSLSASLVFEQSYGGVDGDSASSAELYALLSALADLPIRQRFAVTGSVDQFGRVQAIGGVNEKIEGFYDVCAARGLTGDQGVLIPAANVQHLNLRADVADAVAEGRFAIFAVDEIDRGIEILTGVAAGAEGPDGWPEGSVNARVSARLAEYAEKMRAFARRDDTEPGADAEDAP